MSFRNRSNARRALVALCLLDALVLLAPATPASWTAARGSGPPAAQLPQPSGVRRHGSGEPAPAAEAASDSTPGTGFPQVFARLQEMLRQGRYAAAEARARSELAALGMTTMRDSAHAAYYLDILIQALWQGGKASGPEAWPLAERSLRIRERLAGPDSFEVDKSLDRLAIVLSMNGEYAAARPLYERALAIRERNWGPDHNAVAACLNNLGILYRDLGDYVKARALQERAVAIWEKTPWPDPYSLALTLDDLAVLQRDMGDEGGARALFERSLSILQGHLGPEHPDVAASLHDLADLLAATGDHAAALAAHERALAIREKVFGPDGPDVALSLLGLGRLMHQGGKDATARVLLERALSIQEKRLGPNHLQVASTLAGLAEVALDAGDVTGARRHAERALAIRGQVLGPEHPDVGRSFADLAAVLVACGELQAAFAASLRAEDVGREHARLMARALPERHALRYASVRASGLDLALALAVDPSGGGSARDALDAVIRSRALVLDETAHRHRIAGRTGDAAVEKLHREVARASERLANLLVRGPGKEDSDTYRRRIDGARQDEEAAERALAEKSAAFRAEASSARAGLAEVAEAIPPGAALLSYALHAAHPGAGVSAHTVPGVSSATPRLQASTPGAWVSNYVAFVLRHGEREPIACTLGPSAVIDTLVAHWRAEASRGALAGSDAARRTEADYRAVAAELRRRIWDPVAPHVRDVRRLFVIPDGALHLVTLAALPAEGSGYLLESGPLFHYMTTERDLVAVDEARAHGAGLLCLGGPEFDAPPARAGGDVAAPAGRGALQIATAYRGGRPGCADFQALRFEPLPGALREAEQVADVWRTALRHGVGRLHVPASDAAGRRAVHGEEVLHLTGAEASEAAFKTLAPGKRVLHLATHGFFLGGQCPSALVSTRGVGGFKSKAETAPREVAGENPLRLAGLALAGANRRAEAGADEEDGVLTAEEIAALDLSGVEWAVLSACDTGVGEPEAGEGIMGLRRAFQVAGAGTLILSLWPVGDESARLWMHALYDARLVRGLDTPSCMREASLSVLRERRRSGSSTHPFHWGGFVAAGAWN